MSDQNDLGQNEEEMEEEILINQEDGEEEGGEVQDVYAFDMQINDDAYLIIIGKTDENKIFLRLMDKEDQSKPFYHGEFSLEDLRVINQIFNGIDSEDIAFQYLALNLNEAEKTIKLIDDEKINFHFIITDKGEKSEFDFILIKCINDGTGEYENEVENVENEMEEEQEAKQEQVVEHVECISRNNEKEEIGGEDNNDNNGEEMEENNENNNNIEQEYNSENIELNKSSNNANRILLSDVRKNEDNNIENEENNNENNNENENQNEEENNENTGQNCEEQINEQEGDEMQESIEQYEEEPIKEQYKNEMEGYEESNNNKEDEMVHQNGEAIKEKTDSNNILNIVFNKTYKGGTSSSKMGLEKVPCSCKCMSRN